jgi:hypothetical protein
MAQFVNFQAALTTTLATVGTIPTPSTDKAHVVIGLNVANTDASNTSTVDVAVYNATGPVTTYIAKGVQIPVGGNIDLVDGKIVLASGDQIHAKYATGTADLILSVLQDA